MVEEVYSVDVGLALDVQLTKLLQSSRLDVQLTKLLTELQDVESLGGNGESERASSKHSNPSPTPLFFATFQSLEVFFCSTISKMW